jgi:2-C-methyl-D-erythritol 4-phosphate cytidylyltransferase
MPANMYDDPRAPALGTVLDQDRGSLPYALIHGESLVACASWALGEAGVTLVDFGTTWAGLQRAEEPMVLHDALCPLTPSDFIAECVATCVETGSVVVGVHPVGGTENPAEREGERRPVDREARWSVAAPVVLPVDVVADLDGLPSSHLHELVRRLEATYPIVWRPAPTLARRVTSIEEIADLETLAAP